MTGEARATTSSLTRSPLDREVDGLNGKVLKVRTEQSKLTFRAGKLVEGLRVLLGTSSYDLQGKKTADENYPVPDAPFTGKEIYSYDKHGNITEMIVRKAGGGVLRREVYSYEFDRSGNWTKMITSAPPPGQSVLRLQPVEVTYRIINYYPEEIAADKSQPRSPIETGILEPLVINASHEAKGGAASSAPTSGAGNGTSVKPASDDRKEGVGPVTNSAPNPTPNATSSPATNMSAGQEVATSKPKAAPTAISKGVVIGKATYLAKPIYTDEARRANVSGVVPVEVEIDETGRVISARATNGPLQLRQAAAQAATESQFNPTYLSGIPIKISGLIKYNFNLNDYANPLVNNTMAATGTKPLKTESVPAGKQSGAQTVAAAPPPSISPSLAAVAPAAAELRVTSVAKSPDTPELVSNVYRLGIGDVLDIHLPARESRKSSLYRVSANGLLDYPLAGDPIKVAGMTTDELGTRLAAELKRRGIMEQPDVLVSVREYASHKVLVSGLVDQPGEKILRQEATPLFVVLSQSFPRAEAGRAIVTSVATGKSRVINLLDPEATNLAVHAGDTIHVSSSPLEFYYIGGEIKLPGRKEFHSGVTLTQALLESGGLTQSKNSRMRIRVSRQDSTGRLISTDYSLMSIEDGQLPDPSLQAGDRIMVSSARE